MVNIVYEIACVVHGFRGPWISWQLPEQNIRHRPLQISERNGCANGEEPALQVAAYHRPRVAAPIGIGHATFWENAVADHSGIAPPILLAITVQQEPILSVFAPP